LSIATLTSAESEIRPPVSSDGREAEITLPDGGSLTIQTLARRWPKQPAAHRFDGNGMRCTGMANRRQKHSEPVEAELK